MLTILVPCAGEGKRFKEAGYKLPKPLIDVNGKPMLQRVIENVRPKCEHRWVFVCHTDDKVISLLESLYSVTCTIDYVGLQNRTKGALNSCLYSENTIFNSESLLIVNCDQLVDGGIEPLFDMNEVDGDAAVLTMKGDGSSRWSYADVLSFRRVHKIIEKPPQPNYYERATTGHYYYKRAGDFFAAAKCMIEMGDTVNNEFYVAPTMNYLIAARKTVREVRVEDYGGVFHGLGTPEDLEKYLRETKA